MLETITIDSGREIEVLDRKPDEYNAAFEIILAHATWSWQPYVVWTHRAGTDRIMAGAYHSTLQAATDHFATRAH